MFVVTYVDCDKNKVAVLDTKDNVTEEIAASDFCSLVQSGAITVENAMVTDDERVLNALAPSADVKNTLEIDVAFPNDDESISTKGYIINKTTGTLSDVSHAPTVEISLYNVPYITDKWVQLFVKPVIDSKSLIGEELSDFKSDGSRVKDITAVLDFITERRDFLEDCYYAEAERAAQEIEAVVQKYDAEEKAEGSTEGEQEVEKNEAKELEVETESSAVEQADTPEAVEENRADEALQAVADRFSSSLESAETAEKDESTVSAVNGYEQSEVDSTKKEEVVPEIAAEATIDTSAVSEEKETEGVETKVETEDASDALKAFANRYSDETVAQSTSEEVKAGTDTVGVTVEAEAAEGELENIEQSTNAEPTENESSEKEVKGMATKSKKTSEVKSAKAKKSVVKAPAKSPVKAEKTTEQGIVTSKKFTLRGKKYLCEIKTENFENGKDKVVLSKTCSDFMYFCGNDAEVFMPEVCLSDIQLKDKVLSIADTMLSGYVFDSKGIAVSLYDVCVGKSKALQVFRPYAPELGVYNDATKKIVIFVTAL